MLFPNFGSRGRWIAAAAICAAAACASALETVAITEYINHTAGDDALYEWVELYNFGNDPIVMTEWRLKDDDSNNMLIPAGTSIAARNFVVLARNKSAFESRWLGGVITSSVIQYGTGSQALSDTGGDELVLTNAASQTVWRLAYGAGDNNTRATFYALDDLGTAAENRGTKAAPINRNGADPLTGNLGYEGNEFTHDPWAFAAGGDPNGDFGSPLRGAYTGAANPPVQPLSWTLDVSTPGKPINQGVRGLAIADQALDRGDNSDVTGIQPSLEIAEGSAIRGVAGGLYADLYDWKRRNDMPRPPTLEFQRWARDHNETLYVTANTRGLTIPNPDDTTHRIYYTSDTETLAQLAGDWVRYTNRIVQTYRQGDAITDTRDAEILTSLTWSSSYVNPFGTADNYTTLLAQGEPAVAPVKHWEIGNEPTISLNNAYSVDNGFVFTTDPGEYRDRYLAITAAMLAEDPTVKVGPCVVNGRAGRNADILSVLFQSDAQIDFISYHPYGSMGDFPNQPIRQQGYLANVYNEQFRFLQEIKDLVALYRPAQAESMQYVASETNVSDFRTNNTFQEGTMAHALGSVETVMGFARLGLEAAHYWIWITATPTYLADTNRYAVTMAFEKLRDRLGDEMLGAFDANDKVRVYVIRDFVSGNLSVWAMNFSHTDSIPFNLSLTGGPTSSNSVTTKTVLQTISGPSTNLFSANLNPEINGGVARRDVDWSAPEVVSGSNPANMALLLPAATLTLLTIEQSPEAVVDEWPLY